jgi:cytidine deaminase
MKYYKLNKKDEKLIKKAKELVENAKKLKMKDTGGVGSCLITDMGNIYCGISMGFYCGIGSCGEYQAIGSMITNGERIINTIVAVTEDAVYPPCGRCREMIFEAHRNNLNSWVIISKTKKVKLKELLPLVWQEVDGEYL